MIDLKPGPPGGHEMKELWLGEDRKRALWPIGLAWDHEPRHRDLRHRRQDRYNPYSSKHAEHSLPKWKYMDLGKGFAKPAPKPKRKRNKSAKTEPAVNHRPAPDPVYLMVPVCEEIGPDGRMYAVLERRQISGAPCD